MKLSISTIFLATSASAFTLQRTAGPTTARFMSEDETPSTLEETTTGEVESATPAATMAAKSLPKMSMSLPFMERPSALDGSLAGDVGFDPLGFAKSKEDLMNYREAEIKHARLAMLAAAGWPISELWDKKIAALFGLPAVVDSADRAPSVLNGGLDKISPVYWVGCILMAGAIDAFGTAKARSNDPEYFPGNLGFDPLSLFPSDAEGQLEMQTKELKNGRLAMIAITAFAAQEFVSNTGVIDETPLFFKPIGAVLKEYANSGYIN
mmetsp:Transcript_13049/g.19921  ORF Transcript_13049/g.19921 Transcript_13049/m.19921 type:complete len:266 (-) Transcript_13049:81-878(-)|eukprot:CAMPEP_0178907820 /NCGR_PEP_ID=MMETSP0786-20121207/7583_1 /TAXON_ID=186022 /ORGANISM="Thalassionema frauenfeldii, Strain CCMP 1798" /LENGTH=265 /DNA_ID=CAMNT_0020579661 /DNA_START=211 /DNA_END=1008 /DNA_ORIENTATION=+